MRVTLLAMAVLVTLPGCVGMCGPTSGSVETAAYLDARPDGTNMTRWSDTLVGLGFTMDDGYLPTLHAVRDGRQVWVQEAYGNASTEVRMSFRDDVREFRDSESGHDAALRHIDAQASKHQAEAQALDDALRAAVGLPARPLPALHGYVSIC